MSRDLNGTTGFERQLQALLQDSVQRVSGHARSRLNQARHAALAEAVRPGRGNLLRRLTTRGGRRLLWMPAAGAVAAGVLVAVLLWPRAHQPYPAAEASHATVEDLDLLADRDGMGLLQSGDGQFYEWAMAQSDKSPPAGSDGPDKGSGAGRGGDTNSG